MQDQYEWGHAEPVDVFIMADGEPSDRTATKVGGMPFRSRSERWPVAAGGRPMLFIAQFNFSQSRDIVGELPGEILLVFGDSISDCLDEVQFEWQPRELADLIEADEIPSHPDSFAPCFGYCFRTESFPTAKRKQAWEVRKYPTCRGKDVWRDYYLLQYQATQIGRAPRFIQRDDDKLPGKMLCAVSSVCEKCERPYPFINRPDPVPLSLDFTHLMLGDTGCIYISIDDDYNLQWGWSSF